MDKDRGKQKTIVKIICLLLSFGLWLYVTNVENPIKSAEVSSVDIEIQGKNILSNNNLALTPNQKFKVDLQIEGKATEVYKVSREDFKLNADLSAYALKKGENIIPIQVVKKPDNINIKTNGYLAIKLMIEELKSKEFQVVSDVKVVFKEGVYGNQGIVTPEKIRIEGPESSVEKVKKVSLVGEINGVEKDFKKEFTIKALDEYNNEVNGIKLSQSEGTLEVKVSEGKVVPIKLKTIGALNEGLKLEETQLSQSYIEITGNKEVLKNISVVETEGIDLSTIVGSKDVVVKVVLPQDVKVLNGSGSITVKFKVSNTILEKEIDVNLDYVNLDETNLTLEEDRSKSVKIKIKATSDIIKNLKESDFIAEMNLKDKKEGNYEDVPIVKMVTQNNDIEIEILTKAKYTLSLK